MAFANKLNPEKALIFRISHIDNVSGILSNGLVCRNRQACDAAYVQIGNLELIGKREHRKVPVAPFGTLSDYVSFYFTPYTPMLLNIKTGYNGVQQRPMNEIVILVSSLHKVQADGHEFVFTDRHAYLEAAKFYSDLADLSRLAWPLLQIRDFKKDSEDPGKFERYQAEALVHRHLPVSSLYGIVCYGNEEKERLEGMLRDEFLDLKVHARANWFI